MDGKTPVTTVEGTSFFAGRPTTVMRGAGSAVASPPGQLRGLEHDAIAPPGVEPELRLEDDRVAFDGVAANHWRQAASAGAGASATTVTRNADAHCSDVQPRAARRCSEGMPTTRTVAASDEPAASN